MRFFVVVVVIVVQRVEHFLFPRLGFPGGFRHLWVLGDCVSR